jgi:hypothetical protein
MPLLPLPLPLPLLLLSLSVGFTSKSGWHHDASAAKLAASATGT